MTFEQIASWFASQGVLGMVTLIALWALWKKDGELTDERKERISDAKNYNELSLKLQGQVLDAVNKVFDILEELKKLREAQQRGGRRDE